MRRCWVKILAVTVVVPAALFTVVDRVAVHHADEDRRVPLRTACGSARSVTW
jgi:hypothetical protein